MRIRVRFEHWLPKLTGYSITLYPFILFKDSKEVAVREHTYHHEWIHIGQIRKLGVLKFYFLYLYEYAKNYIKLRDQYQAYMAISFEIEAYGNQNKVALSDEAKALIA